MSRDQEVTVSLLLLLALVVILTSGASRFFAVVLTDALTYHPTQLTLTPSFSLPKISINIPNPLAPSQAQP